MSDKTDIVEQLVGFAQARRSLAYDDDTVAIAYPPGPQNIRLTLDDLESAAATIRSLRTLNAELRSALAVSEKTLELTRRQHSLAMDCMADKMRALPAGNGKPPT